MFSPGKQGNGTGSPSVRTLEVCKVVSTKELRKSGMHLLSKFGLVFSLVDF